MNTEKSTLQAIRQRLSEACRQAGRAADTVRLLAVSKTVPAEGVRVLAGQGQREFGESYLQEAVQKMDRLADLSLCWHFIGPLQRNKTSLVAGRFGWVHSVDRLLIAERLSAARPETAPPLNVCLQVSLWDEAGKSGVRPEEIEDLAGRMRVLPRLRLRGLMAIPPPVAGFAQQREQFAAVREWFERLNRAGAQLDTLSMGMSEDFAAAIAEGATIVRIGRALFGERSPRERISEGMRES